jgi:hypothetical protein
MFDDDNATMENARAIICRAGLSLAVAALRRGSLSARSRDAKISFICGSWSRQLDTTHLSLDTTR